MARPNILLITSDQQRWDTLGVYNPAIHTPNLDRLAAGGVVYDRAYTTNPTCTPARCSILTGHYASRHGCYCIGTSLPDDYPTVPAELSRTGYFTALLGKAHFQSCLSPDSFEAAPHIHNLDYFRNWDGPFYGFDYAQLVIGHSVEKHACGMHYGVWLRDQGVDVDKHFGNWEYAGFGPWTLPEEVHNSTWTADITIEAMDKANEQDKPFFLWASFQDPHNPCFVPEPWASMYDPDDLPVYGLREGEMDDKPPIYQRKIDTNAFDGPEVFGRQNWHPTTNSQSIDMTPERTRDIITKYYGMVSLMDLHIGRILDALEERGLAENTIVVFTSDHGDYLGNHGLWWKGLPAYDDVLRVPFIVRHPECQVEGTHSEAIQSLVDLGTTFLDLAGVEPGPLQQGVVQTDTWTDPANAARDWALVESRPTDSDFMQKVFYHDRYKLVVYSNEEYGELYDMTADPDQLRNLYDLAEFADMRNRLLRAFIAAEMEKEGMRRKRIAVA
ncbi:MAG: sulfatase-like hydrolase/transferase [Lentisphaerae bacterium]|jgi:arylsulfatase A-like enzyme|nr:sulfatase-like hydrolase/transferase [Lentisphaerota bacterium]MBT4822988.1 sulfatase-like hydrolase/transferase [Lentisphaerota bacterium]MBT5612337.1 sulfatase-like hydrolase/transferase [Lentisphaerota bacterium]MBT7056641.1 sulfatase-like hydrolase/transferase [Lentisphaerota bacterium]MBT7840566.1 sulfatase-like hydrolase/transferase [Lentisphaerota bacterium]